MTAGIVQKPLHSLPSISRQAADGSRTIEAFLLGQAGKKVHGSASQQAIKLPFAYKPRASSSPAISCAF
jgi:hypothetical protein